ncbi:Alcohol dehydrogenase superfamily zinc-containing [Lasiodiplodia theobromae]|uniref:Alcohol dehydrogenase superfamily zinc-containing n=1 Tax=Lasiodiplodia theobromae TaxID=45133 RepID=A0A8H7MB95_9PEZI|nr:Alcohol dehydrogenase superfamily zinc-containing [Lasiodiplodia theobromae]
MSTMKVLKINDGSAAIVSAPIPSLRPNHILVKTIAVALNPTDWKHIWAFSGTAGCTSGCDYAGVVTAVNPGSAFKPGDRVAGWTHGGNISNKEDGSFAEYLVANEGIALKIPEGVSFEQAATLGVGITTVGQGVYQTLGLPLPGGERKGEREKLLVYGGSTATGTLAVQFAKLSGFEVIATSSPRNFALLKALGADAVFDYNSPTVGADIRKHTANRLYYAFDCISEGNSAQICADALSTDTAARKPSYAALLYTELPREDVVAKVTMAYTVFGEGFWKPFGPGDYPASTEDYEFGKKFWKLSEKLLEEGKLKVHPPDVRDGGLEGVLEGLRELKDGKVSGKKLVYKIAEP